MFTYALFTLPYKSLVSKVKHFEFYLSIAFLAQTWHYSFIPFGLQQWFRPLIVMPVHKKHQMVLFLTVMSLQTHLTTQQMLNPFNLRIRTEIKTASYALNNDTFEWAIKAEMGNWEYQIWVKKMFPLCSRDTLNRVLNLPKDSKLNFFQKQRLDLNLWPKMNNHNF